VGINLPSSTVLKNKDVDRIVQVIREALS